MKGEAGVVNLLNKALASEVQAVLQYLVHASIQQNWGLRGIATATRKEAIEEMHHIEKLMDRVVFLDGVPDPFPRDKVQPGEDLMEQLRLDLELEMKAIQDYTDAIDQCHNSGDYVTKNLFEALLADEQAHVNHLEEMLQFIGMAGIENALVALRQPGSWKNEA